MEAEIRDKYTRLTKLLIEKGVTITTMESCTGGLIASLITDTEGASAVMKGAFVTYSNEAKIMAGVDSGIIEKYGVYSKETAEAMAIACKDAYGADIGVGVTGSFLNADPNNEDSVPQTVYYAIATETGVESFCKSIPLMSNRPECKMFVADLVADSLFARI